MCCPTMFGNNGIIPACAGSSRCGGVSVSTRGDHPRVCGEQSLDEATNIGIAGSSPRVRGAVKRPALCSAYNGIIPACAGSR